MGNKIPILMKGMIQDMVEYKAVQGSQISVPEIEINVDTVYVRTNIQRKSEIDEYTKEIREFWEYDEKQYTFNEYVALLSAKVDNLAKENIELRKINEEQDALLLELASI